MKKYRISILAFATIAVLFFSFNATAQTTEAAANDTEAAATVGSPMLIVSGFSASPETVEAGESFEIRLTIKNISETGAAEKIKLTLKDSANEVVPENKIGSIYISRIAPNESKTVSIGMSCIAEAKSSEKALALTMNFQNENGMALNSADEVYVNVKAKIKVEFDKPALPSQITSGETVPLKISCYNTGNSVANNVYCTIEGDGLVPDGRAFFGNVQPGEKKSADVYILATPKNFGDTDEGIKTDDAENYGKINAEMKTYYEDSSGNIYGESIAMNTEIVKPAEYTYNNTEEPEKPKAGQWWISVAVLSVCIIAVLVFIYIKHRKNRKLLENEVY